MQSDWELDMEFCEVCTSDGDSIETSSISSEIVSSKQVKQLQNYVICENHNKNIDWFSWEIHVQNNQE